MPAPPFARLTPRERQLAEFAADGVAPKEADRLMGWTASARGSALNRIRAKLDPYHAYGHGWPAFAVLCHDQRALGFPHKPEYRPARPGE